MKKSPAQDGHVTVVFELPASAGAERAAVLGEFTAWTPLDMNPMGDGSFALTVELPVGRHYRFRYLIDGIIWENDWEADGYEPNPYGGEDSVVRV